jgi:DNA adenine methylase
VGTTLTPLRYPGGKSRLAPFIKRLMDHNQLTGGEYVEVYAGGSGVALALLSSGHANRVHINDLNPGVFAFWKSVFKHCDELCQLIRETPVSMRTWRRQREIFTAGGNGDDLALGFATFFLNRTNRSGILTGGVIGGKEQSGKWRMDVRYNKDALSLKIETISTFADRVRLYQLDAEKFLKMLVPRLPKKSLIYLDPPYFSKSKRLYQDLYSAKDHARLSRQVRKISRPWLISYDDVAPVRQLYDGCRRIRYGLPYSAGQKCSGAEVLFFSRRVKIPSSDENPFDGGY